MTTRRQRISPRDGERSLEISEIEIRGLAGYLIFTPNSLQIAVFKDKAGVQRLLGDPVPDLSTISARTPTYQYRTDEVRLHLTFDEIERMVRLKLMPKEFQVLRDKCGIFHEIREDCYDRDGIPIKPQ